jgi:hypothetical protein
MKYIKFVYIQVLSTVGSPLSVSKEAGSRQQAARHFSSSAVKLWMSILINLIF